MYYNGDSEEESGDNRMDDVDTSQTSIGLPSVSVAENVLNKDSVQQEIVDLSLFSVNANESTPAENVGLIDNTNGVSSVTGAEACVGHIDTPAVLAESS